mmetsp:Transcript_29777/g.30918  ORF Transcript_29777/g.30918 Transcript_29777/m.30918 type:complete len:585 (+) Transcript_29777:12-1766(+)
MEKDSETKVSNTTENTNETQPKQETIVTIEKVVGRIDYDKLIQQFGTEKVTEDVLKKFERVTGKPLHPWLKRGIFFSHRDLNQFLDAYENGDPVFLYTGRGPSSDSMHIGHLIPFIFIKYLQDVFDCPLVIQLSDEEKYAFKKGTFEELHKMGMENSKDIMSVGLNPKKTFIFSNRDYRLACPKYEMFVSDMKVNASIKEVAQVFGFKDDGNVGMYDWPFYQSAASFSQAFPHIFGGRPAYCLIPCAIDQDPYFRLSRDLASRMNLLKTSTIYSTFLPPLMGLDGGKMSSSVGASSTLFLNDEIEVIKKKIKKFSKSGSKGDGTLEDHKKLGGDVDEDIACQYLKYFELDEEKLNNDLLQFSKGELTCSEMKEKLSVKIADIIKDVSEKRSKFTPEDVNEYFSIKPIALPKPKEKEKKNEQKEVEDFLVKNNIEFVTTYHEPLVIDEDYNELRSKLEGTLCKVFLFYGQEKFYLAFYDVSSTFANDKLKLIAKKMGLKKIAVANVDSQRNLLKCETNFLSLFGLLYDKEKKISEVWVDENINKKEKVNFAPIRNDARITIKYEDMVKIVKESLGLEIKEFNPKK